MANFPFRLRFLRERAGLSQQELADRVGLSKSSVNMYERGEREPGIESLEAFADLFNVDMDYLVGRSDVENRFRLSVLPAFSDDFTYAAHNYSGDLTPEDKMKIMQMMATLAAANEGDDADGPTD